LISIALALATLQSGGIPVDFRYLADRELKSVNLAGGFNNWNKGATPMRLGANNVWTTRLTLAPGKHYYKFVIDGETWIVDPKAKKNEDDGNGNVNSVVFVLPPDYSKPAVEGDATITLSGLRHERGAPDFNYDRGKLRFMLQTRAGDVGKVTLRFGKSNHAMNRLGGDEFYDRFSVEVPWSRSTSATYAFQLETGKAARYFGPKGMTTSMSGNTYELNSKAFTPFETPAWVERAIIYQIFPDRFDNGDASNDPARTVPWDLRPQNGDDVYGGDFAGVKRRVAHFKSLGVDTIYLNPIFASPVIHRYETSNYLKVDPILGTNDEFASLTKELKRQGIGVVLDGVFNHVAPNHPAFADLVQKQQNSKYKDWFFVNRYPVAVVDPPPYEAWWGFKSMPKVNLLNREAAKDMLSVPKFWNQHAEIAGWRLDVANEVPMEFWREFRKTVKGLGKDKWIVGEVWGDGSPWLKGDQWDSVMNYQFRDAALRFVAEGRTTPSQFMDRLMAVYGSYAPQVSRNMMNLLSSHDTPRFMTLCGNNEKLHMLGASLMFSWVGAPTIYYGDELGMQGERDPDNRRGMTWETATSQNAVYTHFQKLTKARRASRALQSGDPIRLFSNDSEGTLGFERRLDDDRAFVFVNRSNETRVVRTKISIRPGHRVGRFVCALSGKEAVIRDNGTIEWTLEPLSAAILLPRR